MGTLWFLFPIAFASRDDCVNLSPNVTDEECTNLNITLEFADVNENCTQALFKEKYKSLDDAFAVVIGESFTAMRQKQKEEVWLKARRDAEAMHQDEDDIIMRVHLIVGTTTKALKTKSFELRNELTDNLEKIKESLTNQKRLLQNATAKLVQTQNALQLLSTSMREFTQLHNLYVVIRSRSNRVHHCNAQLQRVSANLMLRGTAEDDEKVLEHCKNLWGEDLTHQLREASALYCSPPERNHSRRLRARARDEVGLEIGETELMTMAECLEETNYPDFKTLSRREDKDGESFDHLVTMVYDAIYEECSRFSEYLHDRIMWRSVAEIQEKIAEISEMIDVIDQHASSISVSMDTCASEARSIYQKLKANAEYLAQGQACGQRMTERWKENVKECLEANKWKSVMFPWYNLRNLLGENNCPCCCFRRSKQQQFRKGKYVSESDGIDASSEYECTRRKRFPQARQANGASARDDIKEKEHKEGSKDDTDSKKARKHKEDSTSDRVYRDDRKARKHKKNRKDGGMIVMTAFATLSSLFFVFACIWRAPNCSWCCFGRSKPQRFRRRKYVSDSDDTNDSSDEDYVKCKHSSKARKLKRQSDRDDKKARKRKDRSKDDKGEGKAKEERKNKKDRKDSKKDKKKNKAESVCDDSRKPPRENSCNPEAERKVHWWRSGEQSLSLSPRADCELGFQAAGDAELRLQPPTTTIRPQVYPPKHIGPATVLTNTRVHRLPTVASTSTRDHISLASDQSEFLRNSHLYQHGDDPRTEGSNVSRYEMNEQRSVARPSSTNNRRQSIENDLEAPGHLFHLPNNFPNNVTCPPASTTLPQIRPSAATNAHMGMLYTPTSGPANQAAIQTPTPYPSPALTSLAVASTEDSGQTARSAVESSHEVAIVTRP